MRQIVLDTFPTWSEHYEGSVRFFYLDVKRLVTIGIGDLVDPYVAGLDFGGVEESVIQNAWHVVKNDRTLDPRRGGGQYASLTTIRMTDAGVAALVRKKMFEMEAVLKTYLPNWDDAPAAAQLAAMSHAWAFGPAFPRTWPSWTRAFVAGDYAGASVQDVPSAAEMAVQNASFKERIRTEQALLACALSLDPDQIDAGCP